jgi:hypothetical protein
MAKPGDNDALVAGVLGFGLGMLIAGAMSGNAPEQRTNFRSRLRETLANHYVDLVNAVVASGPAGREWRITMQLPDRRVLTVSAPLGPQQDALSVATCDEVSTRVLRYLRDTHEIA